MATHLPDVQHGLVSPPPGHLGNPPGSELDIPIPLTPEWRRFIARYGSGKVPLEGSNFQVGGQIRITASLERLLGLSDQEFFQLPRFMGAGVRAITGSTSGDNRFARGKLSNPAASGVVAVIQTMTYTLQRSVHDDLVNSTAVGEFAYTYGIEDDPNIDWDLQSIGSELTASTGVKVGWRTDGTQVTYSGYQSIPWNLVFAGDEATSGRAIFRFETESPNDLNLEVYPGRSIDFAALFRGGDNVWWPEPTTSLDVLAWARAGIRWYERPLRSTD